MAKVWQEFYCTKAGGGCGGYFMIKLNMALDHKVEIVCPKCQHKHRRSIENGKILESGRYDGTPLEEICPTISAYSEKPQTLAFQAGTTPAKERDGAVVTSANDLAANAALRERWAERFGGGYDAAQE